MVGSYARLTPLAAVGAGDLDEVEFILDQAQHKTGEMVLGHEITHRRRQEQRLINLPGAKCLAHETRQNLTRSPLASKKCILSGQAPSPAGIPRASARDPPASRPSTRQA